VASGNLSTLCVYRCAVMIVAICLMRSRWSEEVTSTSRRSALEADMLGRPRCTLYIGSREAAEIVTAGPYSVSRNHCISFRRLQPLVPARKPSAILALAFFAIWR